MRTEVYIAGAVLSVVTVCALAVALTAAQSRKTQAAAAKREQLEQAVRDLQGQVGQLRSQKSAAEQQIRRLQQAVATLTEKRNADQQVIGDLWTLVAAATRRPKEADVKDRAPATAADDKKVSALPDEKGDRKHDIDSIKQLLASSGGNLDAAVHQIITPDQMAKTLEEHAEYPTYWAAAASLAPDQETALAYLQEAAKLYPDSAAVLSALVSAQMAAGRIDESTLAYANELRRLDPTNALSDCYAAQCQFQQGNVLEALQSLSQAGAKGRFSDDRIGMLMARYDYFLNEGVSDAAALGLSAFTLPLEHLAMVRQLGNQSMEQARTLAAAGQMDDALKIAQDTTSLGQTVSSSGRFLIHDRVGIALQQAGLNEQRQIYEGLGDATHVQEIDSKLQAIQERSATIDTMVQGFGSVMANMTEEDVAAYVDGTILNGEFATLQNIPEIAQALQQAQTPPPEGVVQATVPKGK